MENKFTCKRTQNLHAEKKKKKNACRRKKIQHANEKKNQPAHEKQINHTKKTMTKY